MSTDHIAELRNNLHRLGSKHQDDAKSLLGQFDRHGTLTPKQWGYLESLARRAIQLPALPAEIGGDIRALIALFDKANQTLKQPQITLSAGEIDIRLSLAGPASRYHGGIQVTSPEGGFGTRIWYGHITRDEGRYVAGYAVTETTAATVLGGLREFAANPAAVAAAYGKRTGVCCFCRIPLSDPRSTEVGYGKICARNWDLPWGKVTPVTVATVQAAQRAATQPHEHSPASRFSTGESMDTD